MKRRAIVFWSLLIIVGFVAGASVVGRLDDRRSAWQIRSFRTLLRAANREGGVTQATMDTLSRLMLEDRVRTVDGKSFAEASERLKVELRDVLKDVQSVSTAPLPSSEDDVVQRRGYLDSLRTTVSEIRYLPKKDAETILSGLEDAQLGVREGGADGLRAAEAGLRRVLSSPNLQDDLRAAEIAEVAETGARPDEASGLLRKGLDRREAERLLEERAKSVGIDNATREVKQSAAEAQDPVRKLVQDAVSNATGSLALGDEVARRFATRFEQIQSQEDLEKLVGDVQSFLTASGSGWVGSPTDMRKVADAIAGVLPISEETRDVIRDGQNLAGQAKNLVETINGLPEDGKLSAADNAKLEGAATQFGAQAKAIGDKVQSGIDRANSEIRSAENCIDRAERILLKLNSSKREAEDYSQYVAELTDSCSVAKFAETHAPDCERIRADQQRVNRQMEDITAQIAQEEHSREECERQRASAERRKKQLEVIKYVIASLMLAAAIVLAYFNPALAVALLFASLSLFAGGGGPGGGDGGGDGRGEQTAGQHGEGGDGLAEFVGGPPSDGSGNAQESTTNSSPEGTSNGGGGGSVPSVGTNPGGGGPVPGTGENPGKSAQLRNATRPSPGTGLGRGGAIGGGWKLIPSPQHGGKAGGAAGSGVPDPGNAAPPSVGRQGSPTESAGSRVGEAGKQGSVPEPKASSPGVPSSEDLAIRSRGKPGEGDAAARTRAAIQRGVPIVGSIAGRYQLLENERNPQVCLIVDKYTGDTAYVFLKPDRTIQQSVGARVEPASNLNLANAFVCGVAGQGGGAMLTYIDTQTGSAVQIPLNIYSKVWDRLDNLPDLPARIRANACEVNDVRVCCAGLLDTLIRPTGVDRDRGHLVDDSRKKAGAFAIPHKEGDAFAYEQVAPYIFITMKGESSRTYYTIIPNALHPAYLCGVGAAGPQATLNGIARDGSYFAIELRPYSELRRRVSGAPRFIRYSGDRCASTAPSDYEQCCTSMAKAAKDGTRENAERMQVEEPPLPSEAAQSAQKKAEDQKVLQRLNTSYREKVFKAAEGGGQFTITFVSDKTIAVRVFEHGIARFVGVRGLRAVTPLGEEVPFDISHVDEICAIKVNQPGVPQNYLIGRTTEQPDGRAFLFPLQIVGIPIDKAAQVRILDPVKYPCDTPTAVDDPRP